MVFEGLIFFQNTKPSSFGGTKKIVLEEGLYEFFKFNICCYNILKIKNILFINISLSLSKKILFQKM